MKEFNRQNLKALHADINEACRAIAKKHGIHYDAKGGGRYSSDTFTAKVEFITIPDSGVIEDKTEKAYKQNAVYYGLKPEWLHKKVRYGGELWEIVGLKTTSRKYPVLMKNINGKVYKFVASDVAVYANTGLED